MEGAERIATIKKAQSIFSQTREAEREWHRERGREKGRMVLGGSGPRPEVLSHRPPT